MNSNLLQQLQEIVISCAKVTTAKMTGDNEGLRVALQEHITIMSGVLGIQGIVGGDK